MNHFNNIYCSFHINLGLTNFILFYSFNFLTEIVRIFSQPKPAEHLQKVHVIQPEIVHFLRYKNQQPQALAPSLTAPVPLKIVKIVNTPVVNQIPNQGWNVQSANQIPSHGWA